MLRSVCAIFVMSGVSGLVYQVVWVRQFGRIFGNTIYSASLVFSVFMLGLGLGSYWAGRWIDRRCQQQRTSPLRAYAMAELGIAACGVLLAFILPALEPLSPYISSYVQGADGWFELSGFSYALRYLVAILLLAPATILMGATLTLVIRFLLLTDLNLAGYRIGFLYGFNTLGAALGAFSSDALLIPSLGVIGAQMIAVALNLFAALAALRLAQGTTVAKAPIDDGASSPADASPRSLIPFTGLAIFLSGFCAMGMEILWFRYLSMVFGGFRAVLSLLLTVILVGIWLGSLSGGYVERKLGRPMQIYMVTQTVFVASALLLIGIFEGDTSSRANSLAPIYDGASPILQAALKAWVYLEPMVMMVGIPALCMGFAFPLANATIQRAQQSVGSRAGLLYLANTLGAVLGSAATGFLLIPKLGTQPTVLVLAVVGLSALFPMFLVARTRSSLATFSICMVVLGLSVFGWVRLPADWFVVQGVPKPALSHNILSMSEDVYELIIVSEDPKDMSRRLITNGHSMSSTNDRAQRYMRAFSHIPLLHMNEPEDVLVICFGVGTTLNAASLHRSVERLEVVDLSRHVLEHASYFSASNNNVISDPRLRVHVNDGRQHLWMKPTETYDLITLEPPPINYAGVSALYTRDFYQLAKSRLKRGGFMTQWVPAYQVSSEVTLTMVRAFIDVFPSSVLLSGMHNELILMGRTDAAVTIDVSDLRRRLAANPKVAADLRGIRMGTLTELIGTFAGSAETMRQATQDVPPLTDDYPILEYSVSAGLEINTIPAQIFDVTDVRGWCPTCFANGEPIEAMGPLDDYLGILGRYYQTDDFLGWDPKHGPKRRFSLPLGITTTSTVFQQTTYFEQIFELGSHQPND